ncbi:MAG TPA: helix-hairpin-helix domain-containing protein, partial [Anaerolineaceae bacterium]|nr:helix-hairpin-helix domain-containing protein [Anaerolineaceae bacterium]
DDFASMEEVLRRRFNHYLTATEELNRPGKRIDTGFGILPDLLIVDGGKGQLNRAVAVLDEFNLSQRITLVGLAKQEEELFRPGEHDSVRLEDRSQGLFLIQRIRDEAHRFAVTPHRQRRGKIGMISRLDAIAGLGPVRRKALIQRFGSIEGIKSANPEDIAGIKGISKELAMAIKTQLE